MKYTIEFTSDWHIGSGQGRHADADALVVRDADDLPFVPAKTITGVWRDACEQIARGLDGKPNGDWSAWVEWLFGTQPALDGTADRHERVPIPAHVSIRSARVAKDLRKALNQEAFARQKETLTWLKPGVEIDPEQGWAREEYLRFEEVVRPGVTLDGLIDVETEGPSPDSAKALLWAGARIVKRIGGKRRRGLGRCNLTFDANEANDAVKHLQILQTSPGCPPRPPEPPAFGVATTQDANPLSTHEDWVELPLILRLDLPLIVPQRTLGNVVTCRNEIPGTLLLGPVLHCLNADRLHFYHDVAAGRLQVLDATPAVASARALPTPMALFSPKNSGGSDSAEPKIINRLCDPPNDTQLEKCRNRFVACAEKRILADPSISAHTHNTVEDSVQRPTEAVGGVFAYEALAANTRWRTTLRLHPDLTSRLERDLPDWRARLGTQSSPIVIKLGVAKKDDYGLVSMWVTDEDSSDQPESDDRLIVWLTSDLLLRDVRQRPTADVTVLARELGDLLGDVGLDLEPAAQNALAATARQSRRDGWHFAWVRPRPSMIGFAAGSCFAFKADRNLTPAELKAAQDKGLGERRAEGFGQLRLNAPWLMRTLDGWTARQAKRSDVPESLMTLDTSFARRLDRIVWERWTDQSAELFAADSTRRNSLKWKDGKDAKPGNSQLGNLRRLVSLVRSPQDISKLCEWVRALQSLQAPHRRKEHWSNEAINALNNLSDNPDEVWNWLTQVSEPPLLLSGGGQAAIEARRAELRPYALRALLTACIRAAIKQREPHEETVHG